jgi:predicted cupin superfamily sugar epimerase
LRLQPHPEGGWYAETYRDSAYVHSPPTSLDFFSTRPLTLDASGLPLGPKRACSTAIYFLLAAGSVSNFHRIRSAEVWHFYLAPPGTSLVVVELTIEGGAKRTRLGRDVLAGEQLQHVVPGGGALLGSALLAHCKRLGLTRRFLTVWFGAYLEGPANGYALVGCTVAPGFDFADFELARRDILLSSFPAVSADVICQLTRPSAAGAAEVQRHPAPPPPPPELAMLSPAPEDAPPARRGEPKIYFCFKIVTAGREDIHFKVLPSTRFHKVVGAVCAKLGIPVDQVERFTSSSGSSFAASEVGNRTTAELGVCTGDAVRLIKFMTPSRPMPR